ncbi:unnamed protein product [Clavelina lepadiformis]|uniref:Glutaredoxin-2, mitochondrial n=1 Tax=Clavelina lepadiformis TaxID=159417 RepID=A0ABP0GHL2_CLALP
MGASQDTMNRNEDARKFVEEAILGHQVVIFSKPSCPYCTQAKKAFKTENIEFKDFNLSQRPDCSDVQDVLMEITGARSVPRVFINGSCIGGGSETLSLQRQNKLKELINVKS